MNFCVISLKNMKLQIPNIKTAMQNDKIKNHNCFHFFLCRMVAILVNVKVVGRDKIVIKMKMIVPQDRVQMELLA